MMMQFYIFLYLFFMGGILFTLKCKHFLMMLLMLEFLVLVLFNMIFMFLVNYNFEVYFCMMFLSMSVCESALGLALLVSLIRSHGNDYFLSFNLLW